MRGMNSESVDLIYLDPPFNSKRTYSAPIGSEAAGAAFKDTWSLSDVDQAWHGEIAEQEPALYAIIDAAGLAHGKGMKSYLIMMAVRLLEMRRILKPSGSLYLHCDPTASHYIKMTMDGIFRGSELEFQNELTWRRATSHNDPRRYGNITDAILFYASEKRTWNGMAAATPKTDDELLKDYPSQDARGRFRGDNLTGPKTVSKGESGKAWQGFDPGEYGRCWSAPLTGRYAAWIDRNLIPGYQSIGGVHARLDALLAADMVILPSGRRKWPALKRYAAADTGKPPQNLILNPTGFTNFNKGKEYVGYPTQKRLGLLDPLIKASSNEGDVVFDPFCGCATALVSADSLNRQWVGIDLSPMAATLVESRLHREKGLFHEIHHRTDLPKRTDQGHVPHYRTHKHTLFGKQEGHCAGCRIVFPFRNFTVDHVEPKAHGGTDHFDNLQLLCNACNSRKGTKSQARFLAEMKVDYGAIWEGRR